MKKKLYEVEIRRTVYVMAEDESDAADEAERADETSDSIEAMQVKPGHIPRDGWGRGSLVWGSDEDLTLGAAIDAVKR